MANYYPMDDMRLNIARGLVKGTSFNHKFGAVPAMSTNTTGTVWDVNDTLYPWSAWDTVGTVTISRASTSDANKLVTIQGLDSNYDFQEETITLTNPTGNASTKTYSRINRAFIVDGNSATNVGVVDVLKGATIVAQINAGFGQTLMAVYTIPRGYTGYLTQGICSAQASADGTGGFYLRRFGTGVFRIAHSFEVAGAGGPYFYRFDIPSPVPEKADLDVRVSTRSNNGRYTAAFDIILIKDSLGGG